MLFFGANGSNPLQKIVVSILNNGVASSNKCFKLTIDSQLDFTYTNHLGIILEDREKEHTLK